MHATDLFESEASALAKWVMQHREALGPLHDRREAIAALSLNVTSFGGAMLRLTERLDFVGPQYILGRTIYESAVNLAYLCICDDHEYAAFREHAVQKAYRSMDRTIGEFRISHTGRLPADQIPGMQEALARFTSNRGREKPWTALAVSERMEAVAAFDDRAAKFFQLAYLGVYQDASELAHGSLYGVRTFLFAKEDPKGNGDVERLQQERLVSLYQALAAALVALLSVLVKKHPTDAGRELFEAARTRLLDGLQAPREWFTEPKEPLADMEPDVNDPATQGALLALTSEALGGRPVWVEKRGESWCVVAEDGTPRVISMDTDRGQAVGKGIMVLPNSGVDDARTERRAPSPHGYEIVERTIAGMPPICFEVTPYDMRPLGQMTLEEAQERPTAG